MEIDLICLANSKKLGGRCVAGVGRDTGVWYRPVSQHEGGELHESSYTLDTGTEVNLLDVFRIELKESRGSIFHPEDWTFQPHTWRLIERLASDQAVQLLTPALSSSPELLRNTSDRIPVTQIEKSPMDQSLALIEPFELQWEITSNIRGKRQTRAVFEWHGSIYNLAVTDPKWIARLAHLSEGRHRARVAGLEEGKPVFLTASLSEPLGDHCYKLVAAIVTP